MKRPPQPRLSFADEIEGEEDSPPVPVKRANDKERAAAEAAYEKSLAEGRRQAEEKRLRKLHDQEEHEASRRRFLELTQGGSNAFPDVYAIAADPAVKLFMGRCMNASSVDGEENGGYIFWSAGSGFECEAAPSGAKSEIELQNPPERRGMVLVANFHTHPDAERHSAPSEPDIMFASLRGIPSIVMDTSRRVYLSGPRQRRTEATGAPHAYPNPDPEKGYTANDYERGAARFRGDVRSSEIKK